MDVWKTIRISDDTISKEISPSLRKVPEEVCILAKECAQLTEELQNVKQLFDVFVFNLELLHSYCVLYLNDEIIRKRDAKIVSIIEINALVINILSAGASCIEFVEAIKKEHFDETGLKEYREGVKKKLRGGLEFYHFMMQLRDIGQHGNLVISQKDERRFCFDLDQILKLLHFRFKGNVKPWIINIKRDIENDHDDYPHIAVTRSLIMYVNNIIEAYRFFLLEHKDYLLSHWCELQTKIKEHPEYLITRKEGYGRALPYLNEDKNMHLLLIDEDVAVLYQMMIEDTYHVEKKYCVG